MGGPTKAAARLDSFLRVLNAGGGGTHTDHALLGDEPTLETPWLYDWLRRPWKTQAAVRRGLRLYSPTPAGYPGNDDLGTLSAWYVFGALGLYPAQPGTGTLALATPLFERAEVKLAQRRRLVITAPGSRPYVAGLRTRRSPPRPSLDELLRTLRRRHPLLPPGAPQPAGRPVRPPRHPRTAPAARAEGRLRPLTPARGRRRWALVAITALGVALRFAPLGVQSFHHDEVITVMRVDPRQLRPHAARGEGERVEPAALLRPRLGLGEGASDRRMAASARSRRCSGR